MAETTGIVIKAVPEVDIVTPVEGKFTLGFNTDGDLCKKDSDGNVKYVNEIHYKITAGSDILANRFVSYNNIYPDEEVAALGVATANINNTNEGYVKISGVAIVELGVDTVIVPGDKLTSSTDGKCKKATGTMPVNGRALTGGTTTGDLITIKIVP